MEDGSEGGESGGRRSGGIYICVPVPGLQQGPVPFATISPHPSCWEAVKPQGLVLSSG